MQAFLSGSNFIATLMEQIKLIATFPDIVFCTSISLWWKKRIRTWHLKITKLSALPILLMVVQINLNSFELYLCMDRREVALGEVDLICWKGEGFAGSNGL